MPSEATIDVCVCTFRRDSLAATIESLARQAARMRIIVADNDDAPSAEALVARLRSGLSLDVLYLHAPARNIAVARNACLEAATADLVAFIDDDEEALPDWLARLSTHLAAAHLDVVFGPVKARYGPDAPDWLVAGDFLSLEPAVRTNGSIDTGYTANALFRRASLGALRFDPSFGRKGGEDTAFFAALHAAGARLGFCKDAIVTERAAPGRANLRWLMRRAYRAGQTLGQIRRAHGARFVAPVALAKAGYCGVAALASAHSPVGWRRSAVRGALHAGMLAHACGAPDISLYGETP